MKTTVRIALLLSLMIATACRFAADKKDDAVRFLAATVLAELQSATPLEQSSFRDTEPVAPKKEAKPPAVRAPQKTQKPVALVAERGTVRTTRRIVRIVRVVVPATTTYTFCHSVREATSESGKQVVVVVPMADTIGG